MVCLDCTHRNLILHMVFYELLFPMRVRKKKSQIILNISVTFFRFLNKKFTCNRCIPAFTNIQCIQLHCNVYAENVCPEQLTQIHIFDNSNTLIGLTQQSLKSTKLSERNDIFRGFCLMYLFFALCSNFCSLASTVISFY